MDVRGERSRVRVTLMFTDIVASTALLATMGDDAWANLLGWHDATLRLEFRAHSGREVKQVGDGFFAVFERARDALRCAIEIQRTLHEHRSGPARSLWVRVGVHEAEVTRVGDDYVGRGVHEAARIAALASPGEVVTSADTLATTHDRFPALGTRSCVLRGLPDLCDVSWVDTSRAPALASTA